MPKHAFAITLAAAIGASATLLALAGPLSPPAGPPAPTHKTLADIEPRTPIGSLPFIITQPGPYYPPGNLSVAAGTAILGQADHVSIDLNGFTLSNAAAAIEGVRVDVSADGFRLSNGSVLAFIERGILCQGRDADIRDVRVAVPANAVTGISVGKGGRIRGCTASTPGPPPATVTMGLGTFETHVLVESSVATGFTYGIRGGEYGTVVASRASGCTYGITTFYGRITDSVANDNEAIGIWLFGNGVADRCAARGNGRGFETGNGGVFTACDASDNGLGFFVLSGVVESCTSSGGEFGGFVVRAGGSIRGCTSSGDLYGIDLDNAAVAIGNTCHASLNTGIDASGPDNRIERNTITDAPTGIRVLVAGNLIVRNTVSGNGVVTPYATAGAQTIGPIVTTPGSLSTTNTWANFGF